MNDYIKQIYQEFPGKKIIGICFGHQVVAQALGGKVELNQKGWELGVRSITISECAKEIFNLKDATMVSNVGCLSELIVATTTDASRYSNRCTCRFRDYRVQRKLCLPSVDNTRSSAERAG